MESVDVKLRNKKKKLKTEEIKKTENKKRWRKIRIWMPKCGDMEDEIPNSTPAIVLDLVH